MNHIEKISQIERIKHMEQNMNDVSEALKALDEALGKYAGVQEQLRELSGYYGSEEWFGDFDDDGAGKLPPDLRRGVLSEDGVYNLLMENRRLLDWMQELVVDCEPNWHGHIK